MYSGLVTPELIFHFFRETLVWKSMLFQLGHAYVNLPLLWRDLSVEVYALPCLKFHVLNGHIGKLSRNTLTWHHVDTDLSTFRIINITEYELL